jgi:hypothetical protein
MSENQHRQSQLALAFYTGALQGIFHSWGALIETSHDVLDRLARHEGMPGDTAIFAYHRSALIALRRALERLIPPRGEELARTLLLTAIGSQIDALGAAMHMGEEQTLTPAQHVADITEDLQAYVTAWRALCVRAGLQDDAADT